MSLVQLDFSNLEFLPLESKVFEHLVFKINTLGDETIALANFEFDFQNTRNIKSVHLAIKNGDEYEDIGHSDDFKIEEWASNVPLPLGNNLLERLRLIIKIDGHVDIQNIEFQADVVAFPEAFLIGEPRLKRKIGESTIRFKGGKITDIENPEYVFRKKNLEYWWSNLPLVIQGQKRILK